MTIGKNLFERIRVMFAIPDWCKKYQDSPQSTVYISGVSEGTCDLITGEKIHFAKVKIKISPSNGLLFSTSIDEKMKLKMIEGGFLESICHGVLDVMLIGPLYPINRFQCDICTVEMDPRRSSKLAFRFAARDAVQSFLSNDPYNKIYDWGYKV
jgi:hypothetical protein